MELKNKRVLITGGTGFIGSSIVNKLIKENIEIDVIDINNNTLWRIEDNKKYRFHFINLQNFADVNKCIKSIQPNIIFHLGAYVNPKREISSIEKAYSINLNCTKNLILALNNQNYDLFINTGTSEEYGNREGPFKETDRESPVSPYSASKVAATYFCEMMREIFDKPIITVRPFLPYGPKQLSRSLIPSLIYAGLERVNVALTPCEQTRDFIYIDDLIEAYYKLALNYEKVRKMGIFNIGSGVEIKILEIVKLLAQKFEFDGYLIGDKPYRRGESMHYYSSIEKIKKLIDWAPKWNIEDGIDETINWWQNNREIWIKYKSYWV